MQNYTEYRIMGCVKNIRLKSNSLPTIFTSQPETLQRTCTNILQPSLSSEEAETSYETSDVTSSFRNENPGCESSTDTVAWLSRPDVCRCCLADNGMWDLTGAYTDEGTGNEVLLEMLRDCLGINLSNVTEWGPSRFICDSCATNLRQAHNFKQQVLRAENKFATYLGQKGDYNLDMAIVKTEKNLEEHKHDSFERNENEAGDDFDLHDNIKTEETIERKSSTDRLHPGLTEAPLLKIKKKNPRHNYNKKHTKKDCTEKSEDIFDDKHLGEIDSGLMGKISINGKPMGENCSNSKNVRENSIVDYDSDTPISQLYKENDIDDDFTLVKEVKSIEDELCQSSIEANLARQYTTNPVKQVSERKRIRLTCETVLKDTTACPFRHHKSWFQCFYCTLDFMEINMLKEHTLQNHKPEDLASIKRYPRSLQIDITDFQCKVCSINLVDVKNMVKHFSEIHGKIVYKECIADYKVNTSPYTCHICCKQYHVFRTLTTHLNEHYANCICDVCGKSFLNSKRLKVHKRTHESGDFPCTECGKVLKTKTSKANHMESHSKRIIKCHICLKPMKHYNARIKHMSEEHNITHKFKCLVCGREYKIKHYLATHMRQTHGHKNKKCLECGMAFITNHGLKKHMLKHTGVKAFPCTICNKSYARSYTLREHMRGHEAEAKFLSN